MAYCSKCGKLMEDDATFCSSCGTPLQNQNLYMTTNNKSANSIGLGLQHSFLNCWLAGMDYSNNRVASGYCCTCSGI